MHEFAIATQILDITLEHAEKAMASRVLKINLVIGELTGFMDESIRFFFDILSESTKAHNALLRIARVPLRARCGQCRTEFNPRAGNWHCPLCGGSLREIIGGREFYIKSIEVE